MSSATQHRTSPISPDAMQIPRHIAMRLTETYKRLQIKQIDAAHVELKENTKYCKSVLEKMGSRSDLSAQWAALCQHKAKRYSDLTADFINIISASWVETNRLLSESLTTLSVSAEKIGREAAAASTERRTSAQLISFPERRITSLIAQATGGNSARLRTAQQSKSA